MRMPIVFIFTSVLTLCVRVRVGCKKPVSLGHRVSDWESLSVLKEIDLKSLIHTCTWLRWQDPGSWAWSWCCLGPDTVMRWESWGSLEKVNVYSIRKGWIISGQRIDYGRLKIETNLLILLPLRSRMYVLSPWIWVGSMFHFDQQNMSEMMPGQLLNSPRP